MRYEITDSFRSDFKRLTASEQELFRFAVRVFNEAADRRVEDPSLSWPGKLRVRSVQGAPGVSEMTWSFTGPDGRAAWEWIAVGDVDAGRYVAVRWRRIGDHSIFRQP
jgi:hypothetical protein